MQTETVKLSEIQVREGWITDFTGLSIFELDGITRNDLCGEYDHQQLASTLIEAWIPYYECEKCGKADFCKYTEPDPYRFGRKKDIKCGVAVNALQKFCAS